MYTDTLVPGTLEEAFRQAFRDYFDELGVTVRNWDGLFAELEHTGSQILVRKDAAGNIIGFLLMTCKEMTSGFYTAKIGCVEELYVAPGHRRQGHGASLLTAAEEHFRTAGCGYAFLTTDSAPDFYRRLGYAHQPGFAAKNGDPVFVKPLG